MTAQFPKMFDMQRRFQVPPPFNFQQALVRQLTETNVLLRLKPDDRIALAVGSRGISNLRDIVSIVIEAVKSKGATPYIVPAMGSHGGATPQGQTHVLAEYGISHEALGASIDARMEARFLGHSDNDVEVYFAEAALQADGIIVVNRVKPHTNFQGTIGSGIIKMLAIGLGKHKGAEVCHSAAARLGYEPVLRSVARFLLGRAPILFGIAIIEDQNHQTADVRVLLPESIEQEEEKLFAQARALMPTLPFDDIDLLIIDFLGKDLSGAGIDPNVIGRSVFGYSTAPDANSNSAPRVQYIFVRDLSLATEGNAIGIGLADFTTARAVQKIDLKCTYANALTALLVGTAKIPVYFDTDREALSRAFTSLALPSGATPRIVRIESTLALHRFQASEAYNREISSRADLTVTKPAHDMEFDSDDNLLPI